MITRANLIAWTFKLDQVARALSIAREELAFRILGEQDWLELGRAMYGRATKYAPRSAHNESGLFAFEREAIEQFFPAPPSAILVGACGGGRELFGLIERGYRIAVAYDPVDQFIEALRVDPRLSHTKDRLYIASHETIHTIVPDPGHDEVHAAIIGWESYTHLLGSRRRVACLRSLRACCPTGPILLSFFVQMGEQGERAQRFRLSLRRRLGTLDEMVQPGDALHCGAGGIHCFTEASFAAEATAAGYEVRHYREHDFGAAHAVLSPKSAARNA